MAISIQFKLKTLAIAFTLSCAVMALCMNLATKQQSVIKSIESDGGFAFSAYGTNIDSSLLNNTLYSVTSVRIQKVSSMDDLVNSMRKLPRLRLIEVRRGSTIDENAIEELRSRLQNVEVVDPVGEIIEAIHQVSGSAKALSGDAANSIFDD